MVAMYEDITREQLIEEVLTLKTRVNALQEQNDELISSIINIKAQQVCDKLFSTIYLLIAYMDTSFNFIRVNSAYAQADNKTESFFIGKNHFELYPDDENEQVFKSVIETGKPYFAAAKPFVYRNSPERGITYWDWTLQPIFDENNTVVGLLLCLNDVTKRVNLEKKLTVERDIAQKYLDIANIIILVINKDETVSQMNRKGYELLGTDSGEVIGRNWIDYFVPEKERDEVRDIFRVIYKYNEISRFEYYESLVETKNGVRLIGWRNTAMYDENTSVKAILSTGEDITERKLVEEKQRESHILLQTLLDNTSDSIYFKDKEHRFVKVNKLKAHRNGTVPEEMLGKRDSDYVLEKIAEESEEDENKIILTGKPIKNKIEKIIKKNNTYCWVSTTKVPWYNENMDIIGTIGISRDISKEKESDIEIQQNYHTQNVLNSILQSLMESIKLDEILYKVLEMLVTLPWLTLDPKGAIFLVDEIEKDVLIMKTSYKLNSELLAACGRLPFGRCLCGIAAKTKQIVFENTITENHHITFARMRGHGHYCIPIMFKDILLGVINLYVKEGYISKEKDILFFSSVAHTLANIIEYKRAEEKVGYLARYDLLTGIPNRSLFYDRLNNIINHAKRYNHKFALLFIDLDNFKPINDNYGHDKGDVLLQQTAIRIKQCIRESDTIARIGGDEFVVILPYINDRIDVIVVASKIVKIIDNPYVIDDKTCSTTASIGICMFPDDGDEFDILIRNADSAMYEAKKKKGNNFQFFNTTWNNK
ncbi:MAG: diguanylate cyclase [Candidatus Magnetoovum sp. WYHC-5]|nr:diguanylate cyclase [Candidatus Magnetoovum sp. WYHC-5]